MPLVSGYPPPIGSAVGSRSGVSFTQLVTRSEVQPREPGSEAGTSPPLELPSSGGGTSVGRGASVGSNVGSGTIVGGVAVGIIVGWVLAPPP